MCPVCDYRVEQAVRYPDPTCIHPDTRTKRGPVTMLRDYRTESVNVDRSSLR